MLRKENDIQDHFPKTSRDYWRDKFENITDTIIEKIKELKSGDLLTLYSKELSAECLKLVTGLTNMTATEMDRVSQGMIDGCSNYTETVMLRCTATTAQKVLTHISMK